ncbi:MAG TPA: YsnF/AvaK domain-containing protein [Aromatoleum sp.]|uniref:YsnF/AvaK domain-containing protein n=1 Tax=Aromatoleum sp. TaxID=2307007 RepID=UPI002B4828F7|nr:YsnF/AvaK domain-containing protein [Aromatoleum sp.]HJV28579.1 YsnF/AvaK domain-containing protein [Aromatoleum sp.]
MTQTVISVFDTTEQARSAEQLLIRQGIEPGTVHLTRARATADTTGEKRDEGLLSGIGHFFSNLFGTDDSDEVSTYSEALRRGGVVLSVDLPDDVSAESVRYTLEEAGAVDVDARVDAWRQQGWTGYQPDSKPYTEEEIAKERAVLPVIEEQLEVGKRKVNKGSVRVYSRTVETPVQETVNLREERAKVERRPADRPATAEDLQALGEKSVEIEETAERAVVSKTARVVEEVVVGKEVAERSETIEDTVRRTEVETERAGGETEATIRAFEDYEPEYRQDYQARYASQGGAYEEYQPAYRYGYSLAGENRYRDRGWEDIESDVRTGWEREHPNTWERMKLAVRHGWERVTGRR